VAGIKLALAQAQHQAGPWRVRYLSLDDSRAGGGSWDLGRTIANAHRAIADPKAVYYIGEFSSDASKISIPILNQAGLAQLSPSNTYVGLTTSDPDSAADEPERFYPTGDRTYLRIIPRDTVQAAAGLLAMKDAGCARVAIAHDQTAYGIGLAKLLIAQKGYYGLQIVSNSAIDPTGLDDHSYALNIRAQRANCFFFAGDVSSAAVELARNVHLVIPSARIFGGEGVCNAAFTNGALGGVGAAIDPLVECTRLPQVVAAYPGGKAFATAFKARYGVAPGPFAIYGYEAMKVALDTIGTIGSQSISKAAVLQALRTLPLRHSVIGDYRFDQNGDTTLTSYGLYSVDHNGNPVFLRTITPQQVY
jgi:branched-chain amino acid transport system substrate-binding protein